jgi:hypothetical protein
MLRRLALGKTTAARGVPQPSKSAATGKATDPGQFPDLDVLTERRTIGYVEGAIPDAFGFSGMS